MGFPEFIIKILLQTMLHPYADLIPAIFLLILATSLSCTSRSNDAIQQLNLDLATAEPLSFSELASAVEYVALDKRLGYMGIITN